MKINIVTGKNFNTLAAGLGLVVTSSTQAGIVYTDIADIVSTGSDIDNSFSFDIDNDLVNDCYMIDTVHEITGRHGLRQFERISHVAVK